MYGLEIARRLADSHTWIAAPEVVFSEAAEGLIVTAGIDGPTLAEIMKRSLRIDKNPLQRRRPFKDVAYAFRRLRQWIQELQLQPFDANRHLFDHGPNASKMRVLRNLGVMSACNSQSHDLARRITHILERYIPPSPEGNVLLHGDLTPGNVLFGNDTLCVLDFEDLGYGPSFRESLWIATSFQRSRLRWAYPSLDGLCACLRQPHGDAAVTSLYELDFEILRWRQAMTDRLGCNLVQRPLARRYEARIFHTVSSLTDRLDRTIREQGAGS